MQAWDELVGGVIIGDVPSFPRRPDALRRREGVSGPRSAMEDSHSRPGAWSLTDLPL